MAAQSKRRNIARANDTGELALIARIARKTGAAAGKRPGGLVLGIGDDCAILRPPAGRDVVVTTDFSLEDRHFRRDWHSPQSVGHRTLARGLSDLAAMGARPLAAFLSLALPASVVREKGGAWVDGFLEGLLTLATKAGVPLAGGDTAGAPAEQVLADITLLGTVARGRALRRDGARAGDRLFVTGSLGGSAAELKLLANAKERQRLSSAGPGDKLHPHLFPEPRLGVGQWLAARQGVTAAVDVSDGLSTDLHHLCRASQLCAEVEAARLPLDPLLRTMDEAEALHLALNGGEDYELLFTASAATRIPSRIGGVAITEIGRMLPRQRGRPLVTLEGTSGSRRPLPPGGWEHLR